MLTCERRWVAVGPTPAVQRPHQPRYDAFMSTVTDIGRLIERRGGLRGGRPIVAGTSVSVQRIAGWYKLGLSPDEIAHTFGHLSLAQVHAALAYYHSNREEIETYLHDEDAAGAKLQEPNRNG